MFAAAASVSLFKSFGLNGQPLPFQQTQDTFLTWF
jgi:hypothetical protein